MRDRERSMRCWMQQQLDELPDRRARDAWLEHKETEVHTQLAWWSMVAAVIRELREQADSELGPERLADILPQWATWRGLPEELQPPDFGAEDEDEPPKRRRKRQ